MKRYRIRTAVLLILLSGFYLKGYSQVDNEDIKDIIPVPFNSTSINDPAIDTSLLISIELSSPFWPSPVDSVGFFSLNSDILWVSKLITNSNLGEPDYKIISPEYTFDQETNRVYLWLLDTNNGHDIDTTVYWDIIYNKPQVALRDVLQSDQVPGKPDYVVYEENPRLSIHAQSLFTSNEANSYVTKIEIREQTGTQYYPLWGKTAGVDLVDTIVMLPPEYSIEPGKTRSFVLRAIGKTANIDDPLETSAEFPFSLTYMYINFPDTICQVESLVHLEATPAGGKFYGKGIVDATGYFKPSDADENDFDTIIYKYIYKGTEFSVSEDIYVINLPVVDLDGERQVCANSTDVKYTILNAETSKYDYHWQFTGITEVIDSNAVSVTLHWDDNPALYKGLIKISLEGKNKTVCPAEFEYIIDIDPDDAPDKPCVCFGDISRSLLLCSNTNASYYKWFTSSEDSIGFTQTPYFYMSTEFKTHNPKIKDTTTFIVRIANQLKGCYTTGYMCEDQECTGGPRISSLKGLNLMEELGVSVLNNPVHGKMNLNLSGTWSGNFEIIIYSMNGTLMFSASEMKSSPVQDYAFDLDSELSPGVYLVVGLYGNNRTLPVKMIVY